MGPSVLPVLPKWWFYYFNIRLLCIQRHMIVWSEPLPCTSFLLSVLMAHEQETRSIIKGALSNELSSSWLEKKNKVDSPLSFHHFWHLWDRLYFQFCQSGGFTILIYVSCVSRGTWSSGPSRCLVLLFYFPSWWHMIVWSEPLPCTSFLLSVLTPIVNRKRDI